jgi:hypothetical protein
LLRDCNGRLEREHFIPVSVQELLGPATLRGLAWQNGNKHQLPPRAYAHGRVICAKHHDELDGLDAVARDYFKNLMLAAVGGFRAGEVGRAADITSPIDGRSLERWCLKMICGALATENVVIPMGFPHLWLDALVSRVAWPDSWAIYISANEVRSDADLRLNFYWTDPPNVQLLGIDVYAFGVNTFFCVVYPDRLDPTMMHRPLGLGFLVKRPHGGNVLLDVPSGHPLTFEFSWPPDATVDGS